MTISTHGLVAGLGQDGAFFARRDPDDGSLPPFHAVERIDGGSFGCGGDSVAAS